MLFNRLQVEDIISFFELFSFDLLVLTKGKKGATYVLRENSKIKKIDMSPTIVSDIVDSSGAGDAFFSKTLHEYAYTNLIDSNFVKNTFDLANKASRDVLMQVGSRINK